MSQFFLYPVLEFALKQIPRSRSGPIFILRSRKFVDGTVFLRDLSLNNFKWLLAKLELWCIRNITPRFRKRLWNGYPILNQELQNHDPVGGTYRYRQCMAVTPPPRGFNYGMQAYIVKLEHLLPEDWKHGFSHEWDRQIRQADNISLDSHKETTETQTVASEPCVRVILVHRVCWVWLRSLFILIWSNMGAML